MKILDCPLNGPRNISEFACLGEVRKAPAVEAPVEEWSRYTFIERNPAGVICEWWMHVPTSYVFVVERDTRSDTVVATYQSLEAWEAARSQRGKA